MARTRFQAISFGLGLIGLGLLAYLVLSVGVGFLPEQATLRLVTYALLLVAPLLIFLPISQALNLRYFWLFAVLSWSLFGYTYIFVQPPSRAQAGPTWYLIILSLLFAVLTTILTPITYLIGYRFYSLRMQRKDMGRARRQAILLSLCIVAWLLLAALQVFNPLNAILVLAAFAVLEFFFLTRWD